MRQKLIKLSVLTVLFFILPACENISIIDMQPEYKQKLVFTGFIGHSGEVTAFVQTTRNPMDRGAGQKLAATVYLECSDGEIHFLHSPDSLNYFGKKESNSESKFRIKVENVLGDLVSQELTMPAVVNIDSLNLTKDQDGKKYVTLFFEDLPGINYFSVKTLFYDKEGELLGTPAEFIRMSGVFDDKLAVDGMIHHKKRVYYDGDENEIHHMNFILYHLDFHCWRYYNSLYESEGSLADIWLDPTVIYSNMSNGVGIFGSFATDTVSINYSLFNQK